MDYFYRYILRLGFLGSALLGSFSTPRPTQAQIPNYLHTEGSRILDVNGNQVILTGINWFGMETESYAPHGLWSRSLESILDQVVELGFNTIRLPYSNQLFDPSSTPNGISYDLNPDLESLSGVEIMDRVVAEAGERGLKVILDRHRPDSHTQSELWYTTQFSEERWIQDWVMLAQRYSGDGTVIGMDLHNEPHGRATWGSGDTETDWRLAAERAGNAILEVNPNLLIIVEGISHYNGQGYWWGGNLTGAGEHPVHLDVPGRLVYSSHEYGPGVFPQTWFTDPSFPENMPAIWDQHWGYLHKEGIAPVLLGEFGGRSVGGDAEGAWQRALVSYLQENNISYTYWTLNPNSGDTGGILLDDWQSVNTEKHSLLSGYQFPMIEIEQSNGRSAAPKAQKTPLSAPPSPMPTTSIQTSPTPQPPLAATPLALAMGGSLKVRYRTTSPPEHTSDAKPEFIIVNNGSTPVRLEDVELHYWFKDEPGQSFTFHCDWAKIGCENILGEFKADEGENYYLRLRFLTGSETIQPGEDTGEIKIRFNRADWSEIRQSDDYSYSNVSEYLDWDRVALYLGGKLIWGSKMGSTPINLLPGAPTPTPPQPDLAFVPEEGENARSMPGDVSISKTTRKPDLRGWETWLITAMACFVAGFTFAVIWSIRRRG